MRWLLIASLLGFPQVASAQDGAAAAVAPASNWALDYGADRCRIVRQFGEGEARTVFYFEQVEPDSRLSWLVAGAVIDPIRKGRKVAVQFGPGNPPFEVEFQGASLGKFGDALFFNGFQSISGPAPQMRNSKAVERKMRVVAARPRMLVPAEGAEVEWLEIRSGRAGMVRFELGNIAPVFEAMNACMANLLTDWGLDPEREARRAQGPVPTNLPRVAQEVQRSYPSSAAMSGRQATIGARLMIDAQGQITDCTITDLTEAEKFGAGVCDKITNTARFEPALDASGIAMPSYYFVKIRYGIPK